MGGNRINRVYAGLYEPGVGIMVDFNNPLDDEFLNSAYQARREVWGDDITRPRQFVIGRLNTDGSISTVVSSGEFGRVWVREPGADTGDAIQAVNTSLQPHEITANRPVMVKRERGELVIIGKAIQSANYEADTPNRPQTAINREQYLLALIYPTQPDNSFLVNYKGGMYRINNVTYRVPDKNSSDFTATVPGANALSIKVEIDPLTGTYHETTGTAFTLSSMTVAFDNGDLDTTTTLGRFLLGWIRLYDGQTAIEREDVFLAEHMLVTSHDDTQYVATAPGSDTRNDVKATGDFTGQSWIARASQTKPLTDWVDANGTSQLQVMPDGDIITDPSNLSNTLIGDGVGRPQQRFNTFVGQNAGAGASGGTANTNVFIGADAGISIISGNTNVGGGFDTLGDLTTGIRNTAWGNEALNNVVDGHRNTALGAFAGANSTVTLTGSIALGHLAGYGVIQDAEIWIHNTDGTIPNYYGNSITERTAFGTTTPQARVDITGRKDEIQAYFHSLANQTADNTRIGNIKAGNYTAFEEDGTVRLVGTARVRKEIQIKAEALKLGASPPTQAVIGNYSVLQFPGVGITRQVHTSFHTPTDWAIGTDIDVHAHWAPVDGNAGTVVWQMSWSAKASNAGEVISGAGTTTSIPDDTTLLQDEQLESGKMTMAGASLALEDTIGITFFRDPAHGDDDYGSAASLIIIEVGYISNRLGEPT